MLDLMNVLCGKRILVTRSIGQAQETAQDIRRRGGIPVLFPCLAVQCLAKEVEGAFAKIKGDTGVLFTSVNGVECAAGVMGDAFADILAQTAVAAVGEHTAEALRRHGVTPALVPDVASQEGILAAYLQHGLPQKLVFFRAEEGRDLLIDALKARGVRVHVAYSYRSICPQDDASEIIDAIARGNIDAVLLGSAKTARHYLKRIGDIALANRPVIVTISGMVAREAEALGLGVQVVAKQASFSAMLDALEDYLLRRLRHGGGHA